MFIILLQILVIVTVQATNTVPGTVLLRDGNRMPAISFGTFGKVDMAQKVVKAAVIEAIEAGYRQIDTAAAYQNEEYVGEAIIDVIKRGIVTREELWITTKLHPRVGTRQGVLEELQASLKKLKLSYVDLYLVHQPVNIFDFMDFDSLSVWKGMEDVKKLNLTRSIGVCNFNSTHLNRILVNSEMVPAVNEIELVYRPKTDSSVFSAMRSACSHQPACTAILGRLSLTMDCKAEVNPTYASLEIVAYCQSLNITVLSYAPFGLMVPRSFSSFPVKASFQEPIFVQLAEKYGKLPSQVVIRYLIDRGTIPIPRSVNKMHIRTNIDVFDFQLTPEDVYLINELNKNVKVYRFDKEPLLKLMNFYGLHA